MQELLDLIDEPPEHQPAPSVVAPPAAPSAGAPSGADQAGGVPLTEAETLRLVGGMPDEELRGQVKDGGMFNKLGRGWAVAGGRGEDKTLYLVNIF